METCRVTQTKEVKAEAGCRKNHGNGVLGPAPCTAFRFYAQRDQNKLDKLLRNLEKAEAGNSKSSQGKTHQRRKIAPRQLSRNEQRTSSSDLAGKSLPIPLTALTSDKRLPSVSKIKGVTWRSTIEMDEKLQEEVSQRVDGGFFEAGMQKWITCQKKCVEKKWRLCRKID